MTAPAPAAVPTGSSGAVHLVGLIRLRDAEPWARYRAAVPATLVPWGGQVLFRAPRIATLGGTSEHDEVVVVRFPDRAAAEGWFRSDAYQALIPLRDAGAQVSLTLWG